ncbi:hypothetical protein HPB50_014472 [Hyalomma asiaticum]|uniref:Uncharacterized protein n=1 Tax=Hyalomma asiaticum TaxID=266040 RepID=A0ACB7TKQ4_HYAAI|nr:hypothetical protein HPB50_014472 [Hyalomma asiaticum]
MAAKRPSPSVRGDLAKGPYTASRAETRVPLAAKLPTAASVTPNAEQGLLRALSLGVPGHSRATPARETRASAQASKSSSKTSWRPTAPAPHARYPCKAPGRRPALARHTAAFADMGRPSEHAHGFTVQRQAEMHHGDLELREEAAHPGGSMAHLRADSHSMLVPRPAFWNTLMRRVLDTTRDIFHRRQDSIASLSTSQQRDTATETASSSYLMESMIGTTAFFRLSDRATSEPRGGHGVAALEAITSLATVPPQEDLARHVAPPGAVPELNLRPQVDRPPPELLDGDVVSATPQTAPNVSTMAEAEDASFAGATGALHIVCSTRSSGVSPEEHVEQYQDLMLSTKKMAEEARQEVRSAYDDALRILSESTFVQMPEIDIDELSRRAQEIIDEPNRASSGPIRSPVTTTASVRRLSLDRFDSWDTRALSLGVPGPSRATPAREPRASRPASRSWCKKSWRPTPSPPYARNPCKAPGRRPALTRHTAAFADMGRPSEPTHGFTVQSQAEMHRGDLELRVQAAPPGGSMAHLRADSHSMLVPRPAFWDTLLRRVFHTTRDIFHRRQDSTASLPTSQQRDTATETASSSSYLMESNEDTSSRDDSSARRMSNDRVIRAIFLSLFMFAASVCATTAFFRLSDRAASEPRGGHGVAALGEMTSLATVPPQEDLARRVATPGTVPELNLRAQADGPPPVLLDGTVVSATPETDTKVTTMAEDASFAGGSGGQ